MLRKDLLFRIDCGVSERNDLPANSSEKSIDIDHQLSQLNCSLPGRKMQTFLYVILSSGIIRAFGA
jgi:hypothetical protein